MTEMRIWLLIPFTLFVAASAAAAQEVTAGGTAQAHAMLLVTRNTKDFPNDDPGVRAPYKL